MADYRPINRVNRLIGSSLLNSLCIFVYVSLANVVMGVYGPLVAIMRLKSDTTQNSTTECNWSTINKRFYSHASVWIYKNKVLCAPNVIYYMCLHVVSCLHRFPVRKCLGKCDLTESSFPTRYLNTLYVGLPYLNPENVLVEGPARYYISFVIQSKYGKFRPV